MLGLTLRILSLANVVCIQPFVAIVNFQASMCLIFISWTVNIVTLPIRALAALHREKLMQSFIQDMECELEDLYWKNEKLEARLKMAVKERQQMESMLAEIEEEHELAIGKIERLEKQVEYLNQAKFRLRESQTKGRWDSSTILEKPKKRNQPENPTGLVDPLTPLVFSSSIEPDLALDQRRQIALSQSLFSAFLSIIVGFVIWEAKDPCLPLALGLFSVVGLSLRSVVQFFSTVKNRPASHAIALLSFNWFILGALTCPTLPMVAPFVIGFVGGSLRRFGLISSC